MRSLLALLLLLPVTSQAQTPDPAPRQTPSLPPIGLPLPPIGLPLPPLGPASLPPPISQLPSAARPVPVDRGRQGSRPRHDRPRPIYVFPYWGYPIDGAATTPGQTATSPEAPVTTVDRARPSGTVWLEIEPRGVGEVYVDDYLVGTMDDVRGSLALEAGPHRLEIRAMGYAPLRVDVRVEPDASVTVRRTLEALAPPAAPQKPAPPATPIARKPFYFIPGCYLGDVPPSAASLPPGCDPAKAVVVPPR